MPKQITLPLGYDIANNSLGTAAPVSGRTYNFTSLFPDEIPGVLGITTDNVGEMCASTAINKWAAFKPTKYPVPSEPKHYHGVDIDASNHMVYQPPTGGISTPYCPDHFFGYNHNARVPGEKVGGEESYSGTGTFTFTIGIWLPEFDLRFDGITGVLITTSQGTTRYYTEITDTDQTNGFIICEYSATASGETTSLTLTVELGDNTLLAYSYFPQKWSHSITLNGDTPPPVTYTVEAVYFNPDVICSVDHSQADSSSRYDYKVYQKIGGGYDLQYSSLNQTSATHTVSNADTGVIYVFEARVSLNGDGVWEVWKWSNEVQT